MADDTDVSEYRHPEKNIPPTAFGVIRSIHAAPRCPQGANRHHTIKTATTATMTAASVAGTTTTTVMGNGAMALAAGGVAAVGATGVGLVAAGAVLTVGSMGLAMRSAYKTNKHIDGLLSILSMRKQYEARCAQFAREPGVNGGGGREHAIIEQVLIYTINKKRSKLGKKVVASTGLGLATGVHRGGKAIWKSIRRTKGKHRTDAARWLAKHLITTHCPMAQEIVAELLDERTMQWLKCQALTEVVPVIAAKMKSV